VAAPVSLLKGARAFARDMAREAMAPGFLWDVVDFVPALIDTPLTSRGAWQWGSDVGAAMNFTAGILATFTTGEQNLGAAYDTLYEIGQSSPYPLTGRGAVPLARQNPVMLFDQVIFPDGNGTAAPTIIGPSGSTSVLTGKPVVRYGTIWGEYFVGGGGVGHEDTVFWSFPTDVTQSWDPNALWRTGGMVTGLAALRNAILVFHPSSIERLRGSRPPAGTSKGDMVLEPLFKQVGTTEAKSIAYWQENILFADEHGVHITDGSVLRNLVQQGSIQSYWRNIYNQKQYVVGVVFLDYYVVSVLGASTTETLVCDLNSRQWFRFSNVPAISMWSSGGSVGMERFWAGIRDNPRLARLSPMFFPVLGGGLQTDANGVDVLPTLETPYYKLSAEGRKRVRFAYLSYDVRTGALAREDDQPVAWQRRLREEELMTGTPLAAGDLLQMDYILSPQDTAWTTAGTLPATSRYTRHRLPVGKAPYGIALKLHQLGPSTVTRISDIAVDAHAIDRGRL